MNLPVDVLERIAAHLQQLLGLNYPPDRWADMERALLLAASEAGYNDLNKTSAWLAAGKFSAQEFNILVNHLTIGETYFFRDKAALKVITSKVIPEYLAHDDQKKSLRIWSAGCCTGEEPYTIAMMLCEALPDIASRNIQILATDINPDFLAKARTGKYSRWSFRETPVGMRNKYFKASGSMWQIDEQIRKMVTFSSLNLATQILPSLHPDTSHMDAICCRNVLMYFSNDVIRGIASGFARCLKPGAWFVTSPVELNDDIFSEFTRVSVGTAIVYRNIIPQKTQKSAAPDWLSSTPVLTITPNRAKKKVGKFIPAVVAEPKDVIHVNEPSSLALAEHYYHAHAYQECIAECMQDLNRHNNSEAVLSLLTRSYANLGNYEKASEFGHQLIKASRLNAESYFLVGTIFYEMQQFEMALNIFRQGIYLNHDHLIMHFMCGNIYRIEGDLAMANKHFKNVLQFLKACTPDEFIDQSGGLTAGRLNQMVETLML